MGMADGSIETLFQQKLTRYRRLAEVLKEEREQILDADVTELWRISEKKQSLAGEIEEIRGRILDTATAMSIEHGMTPGSFQTSRLLSLLPKEHSRRLTDIQSSLMDSKNEIRSICLENKQYVESKLGMIDELISIITGREHPRQGYGAAKPQSGPGAPMLFRREA
jgi:flagellar biosynthesis/type III secretory pathway chaperone